jgi:hypothetical protein
MAAAAKLGLWLALLVGCSEPVHAHLQLLSAASEIWRTVHAQTCCYSLAAGEPPATPAGTAEGAAAAPGARPRFELTLNTPWQKRCLFAGEPCAPCSAFGAGVLHAHIYACVAEGTWCKDFHAQQPIPWKPAPRGNMSCPKDCNGVGVCQADHGYCMCPGTEAVQQLLIFCP